MELTCKQFEAIYQASLPGYTLNSTLDAMKIKGGARAQMLRALSKKGMVTCGEGNEPRLTAKAREEIALRQDPGRQNGTEWLGQLSEITQEEQKPIVMPEQGPEKPKPAKRIRENTKQSLTIELLRRPEGATIDQIAEGTAWQRHTVRGFLSKAIKKDLGLNLVSDKSEGGTRIYWIADNG